MLARYLPPIMIAAVLFEPPVARAVCTRSSDANSSQSSKLETPSGLDGLRPAEPLRQTFLQRVEAYVALHRQLEGPLPPEVVTDDVKVLSVPREALAAAMRKAREGARQGEIFSPAVARYFRILVATTVEKNRIDDLLSIVEDENSVHIPARVNGDYPAGRSLSAMPPCLLAELPPLPIELQYRFVGRDLVLWDVHAGLIVDFVPDAIPPTTESAR
jgi:hypothetical protein